MLPLRPLFLLAQYKDHMQTNKWLVLAAGLVAVGFLSILDYLTTWEIGFSVFYAIVVCLVSYHAGSKVGAIIAFASTAAWNISDVMSGVPYTYWFALYWNIAVRSAMFLLFVYLVSVLRMKADLIENLARIDFLTGVANGRDFYEKAAIELKRASRYKHAFTLAYIDLDRFKEVNDTLGHQEGDAVLKKVAQTLLSNLRATDCVSRLGGDEFAVLLSETDFDSAARYLEKMKRQLLEAMREHGWEVTFSVGAMTYSKVPESIDDMIRRVDNLMYAVKRDGRNKIKHENFCNSESTS